MPLVRPLSSGRDGDLPLILRLPSPREEYDKVAELMQSAHEEGYAWSDMAVLCPDHATMSACASSLKRRRLPHHVRRGSGDYRPDADTIQVMTMRVSKGLEFPVVALPGVGQLPSSTQDITEAARLFYVAATRATNRLFLTVSGDGEFAQRLLA